MDRNITSNYLRALVFVALRKESVDRNFYYADKDVDWVRSLSARRAWIEMRCLRCCAISCMVALRKESVDRNPQ